MIKTDSSGVRVVVTGMGVVSPIGCDIETFWGSLVDGRGGISTIGRFDPTPYATTFAGEVATEEYSAKIPPKILRRVDRSTAMAMSATADALKQSRVEANVDPSRIGVCLGTSSGPGETEFMANISFHEGGQSALRRAHPYISTNGSLANAVAEITLLHGLQGPSLTVSAECSSGANAIGYAVALIRSGAADAMVCGGTDATVHERALATMSIIGALSRRNGDPAGACRPFDEDRDGFVLGEGSGVLVLESESSARHRGAHILGEVLGYGAATDTHHATAPDPDGRGAVAAMRAAISDAPSGCKIGFINAHATGTELNDKIEIAAIRGVWGEAAADIPIFGIKPLTGHMIAASGAVEAIAVLLSLTRKFIPPTKNCARSIDPVMDIVTTGGRRTSATAAMSTSFGFGGQCAALIFGVAPSGTANRGVAA